MNYVLKVSAAILFVGAIALAARIIMVSDYYHATIDGMQHNNDETYVLAAQQQAIFEEKRRKRQAAQEARRQRLIEDARRQEALRLQARFEHERLQAFEAQYTLPKGCDWPRNEWQWDKCNKHKKTAQQKFFASYPALSIKANPDTPESVEFAARQAAN